MNIFNNITVIDTETTDLDSRLAEICQLATGRFDGFEWKIRDSFYGTNKPIPAKASAKNMISRRMLEGLPKFFDDIESMTDLLELDTTDYYVAHNSPYDQRVLESSFNRERKTFDKKFICTMRLAERLYPTIELKNLSYLRYFLDLNVPDEMEAHRAPADVFVTCCLFEQIVGDALEAGIIDPAKPTTLADQLYEICWTPKEILTFPFGKHKGVKLGDIPTDYYLWAIDNLEGFKSNSDLYDADLVASVTKELEKRIQP